MESEETLSPRLIKPCRAVNTNIFKDKSWLRYHQHTKAREPRDILVKFLREHKEEFSSALDLGCGAFADSVYIAKQGIPVIAIDLNINRDILHEQYQIGGDSVKQNLLAQKQDLAHLHLPKVDLIYSFAALPFCPQRSYINMISNIANSVNANGYLALHFFRNDHNFVTNGKTIGFTAQQLTEAFSYLGFTETQVEEWQFDKTQDGKTTPNLNNLFLTAKAPEILPSYSRNELQEILGLKGKQDPLEIIKPTDSIIYSSFGEHEDDMYIFSKPFTSFFIQDTQDEYDIKPTDPELEYQKEDIETILPETDAMPESFNSTTPNCVFSNLPQNMVPLLEKDNLPNNENELNL